jgi:hydroxymethylbilane synthase
LTGLQIAIGSRGSALALTQASLVAEALAHTGRPTRIVVVETEGDRRVPDTAWGEGAFVAAIERALLTGSVDVAVHSAKDIPTDENARLLIGAYLPRADPRDALVLGVAQDVVGLDQLPRRTRVGTDSPRRTAFLRASRPDLVVHPIHGNVDSRLRRLDDGETGALVLACAGLDRLGLAHRIAERLPPAVVPPAPGQGAIAIQVRRDDEATVVAVSAVDDRCTRIAVEAERAFLRASGGGCRAPIGALATIDGDELDLLGGWGDPQGGSFEIANRRGALDAGEAIARGLAADLGVTAGPRRSTSSTTHAIDQGGTPQRVLVTRPAEQADDLVSALQRAGLDPVTVPTIEVEIDPPRSDLDAAASLLHTYRWVAVTSSNGARAILTAAERVRTELGAPKWAAIASSTKRVLEREGIDVAFQPSRPTSASLAAELPVVPGDRVLVLQGDLAGDRPAAALRTRGAMVDDVIAYRTREAPERSRPLLRAAAADGPIAGVIFTSGSTVHGLVSLGRAESIEVRAMPAVCIGPETADEARTAGFRVIAVSPTPDPKALAATTADALGVNRQEGT